MPRKGTYLLKPHNQIAKCIKEESITGLLWAFIQLSQHEIKHEGKTVTFSGNDLSKFVALLHSREVDSVLSEPKQLDVAGVAAWLVLQQTETETRILFRQVPVLHIQHLDVCIAALSACLPFCCVYSMARPHCCIVSIRCTIAAFTAEARLLLLRHNVIVFAIFAASQIALLRLRQLLHLQHRL
jgi:hypothetical protein